MQGRIAGLALALCLLGAAPAHAAFAPELSVVLDPPTAGGTPALAAAVEQPATEAAIERLTLSLPTGFTATGSPGAATCPPAELSLGRCSDASRIGTLAARAGAVTALAGAIHKTGPASFGLHATVLGGSVAQVVEGALVPHGDGSLDVRFDKLPALGLTAIGLHLYGGMRGPVRAPDQCGTYPIDGKFTSRSGDLAIARTSVGVVGCPGVPAVAVANVRMSKTTFRAGGNRSGFKTIIAWWASRSVAHTDVRIERRTRRGWRVIGVLIGPAAAGDNRIRWDGRLRNRRLKRGTYGVRIHPAGSAPAKIVRFRVR